MDLLVRYIDHLRKAAWATKQGMPFHIDAWVLLPEHMHFIWTLSDGGDDFSSRWKMFKTTFSKGLLQFVMPYVKCGKNDQRC